MNERIYIMKFNKEYDKFKSLKKDFRQVLPHNSLVGVRLDGKSFHTFTKQFSKPYSKTFMNAMNETTKFLLDTVLNNALFAYVQSDEITVFFNDFGENKEHIFGGKVEKILTVSASSASLGFYRTLPEAKGNPIFDARLFVLKDYTELLEYLNWRRLDARKNAVTMAAETLFSSKDLLNVSTFERMKLLVGTPYEKLPEGFFNGRLVVKEFFDEEVEFFHKKTGEKKSVLVNRSKWVYKPALKDFTENFIENL